MSALDPVRTLLARLSGSSETISEAYYHGHIVRDDDNAREIENLRRLRLLSPSIRDTFQLRVGLRKFLDSALNTERLFAVGTNIGELFRRLSNLIDDHAIAYQEGRDVDCERYEAEIREAISDIADTIDDELILLQAQIATRFGAVSTLAEKKRQNLHYLRRTQQLVDLLEDFHFSDFSDQLVGHEDLLLSFRSLLESRIPAFRDSLLAILKVLNQYLFEFRQIENRARKVRAFALHLSRNPDWEPKNWDDAAHPEEWLQCATPLHVISYPDVSLPEAEGFLAEIANTIPATLNIERRIVRDAGGVDIAQEQTVTKIEESPLKKAVRLYYKAARQSEKGLSARRWWANNPMLLDGIHEESWMLAVLARHDKKRRTATWSLRLLSRRDPDFNGNLLVRDAIVSRKVG